MRAQWSRATSYPPPTSRGLPARTRGSAQTLGRSKPKPRRARRSSVVRLGRIGVGVAVRLARAVTLRLLLPAAAVPALVVRAGRHLVVGDPVLRAVLVAHPHGLLVGVRARHGDRALAGADLGADRRQLGGAVAVLGQLV